jgi:hypothetical protein
MQKDPLAVKISQMMLEGRWTNQTAKDALLQIADKYKHDFAIDKSAWAKGGDKLFKQTNPEVFAQWLQRQSADLQSQVEKDLGNMEHMHIDISKKPEIAAIIAANIVKGAWTTAAAEEIVRNY